MSTIKNASQSPQVYYGLHFYPGVAEYREPGAEPYRIFLNETTLRSMDSTFCGCPVYVQHKEEVNLSKLQEEADGYVIESFYNQADGKHWVKFIIVSDRGHQAVHNGWRLSNAYVPESFGQGGVWNGVDYQKEVIKAHFEHLALVQDPRYAESIVLKPSQFKEYNENQVLELKKVANAKEKPVFDLFKKTKVENTEMSDIIVKLPKSGKEMTLAQLINAADQEKDEDKKEVEHKKENSDKDLADEDKDEAPSASHEETSPEKKKHGREDESQADHEAPQMANMDHHVMDGEKSRPLHELMAEHKEMRDCMSVMGKHMKANDSQMDGGEKDAAKAEASADQTKRNADLDGGEKESESQEKMADKTKRNAKFFEQVKNAPTATREPAASNLSNLERGQSRYGSNQ